MIRPKYPEPVYVITHTPPSPAPTAPGAPCPCGHSAPATPPYQARGPVRPHTDRPIGLYLAAGTVAVAGTVALAVAVTALFLAIAVTAISVTVAAVVLRSMLADHQRDQRR
ncbi:hypothetical protein [Phaeacidiphilus oryzae]|uniref:hypothetical protein n=1 Tax=Phaeacidiphilus oryzae TaxID=348818 RepID=UPI00055FD5CB|nr:hypothetical protein [Phaeacidiphilus oryzae]